MCKYVQICTDMNDMCKYGYIHVQRVQERRVLDTELYNLGQADMRWRLYGVEVTVSTLLLPYSSSQYHHHRHHYKGRLLVLQF